MYNKIVIGCAFGDEGKGIAVDNLCRDSSLVVRFSGGQQAGHTVIRNNVKHVFSSYGAGTLKGCPTFFTEDTTFSLPNILKEKEVLASKGIDNPVLYLHPLAMATTPFDVAYNRAKEISNDHGSCGLGIGATMSRTLKTGHKLFAIDFTCRKVLESKLDNIHRYYWDLIQKEFKYNSPELHEFIECSRRQEEFFYDALAKPLPFSIKQFRELESSFSDIVFEGSQGILLDMDHGFFPNVTYANTTSKNALKYCNKNDTEIYYATRCYLTRHGNGWFPEGAEPELINNEEEINVLNKYQGNFRRTALDYDLLNYAISIDDIYSRGTRKKLIVGCVDQIPDFKLDKNKIQGINSFYENTSAKSGHLKITDVIPFLELDGSKKTAILKRQATNTGPK